MSTPHENIRSAIRNASEGLVDRETLVELVSLAAIAREHLLVIGPPGTAKSEAIRRAARAYDATYFEYLLGRFTEPSELVGPIDLRKLREGLVETETAGMLPEAEIAFLDEVFLGSTAILNTLLSLLHERTFRRGKTPMKVPLRVCVAASNTLPEDGALSAFADRFLLRVFVEPVADEMLETLLERGAAAQSRVSASASLRDLDWLAERALTCDLSALRPLLADAIRRLRAQGIVLSDRRIVKAQRLCAAAAVLENRDVAAPQDLWPLVFVMPNAEAQRQAREALAELLKEAQSFTCASAAHEASGQVAARIPGWIERGEQLLGHEQGETRRALIDALLRELDATLPEAAMPEVLRAVRSGLVEASRP